MMTPVDWTAARHVYEDMVSVLLSSIYPDAERIDGSGGDGGRDVQIRRRDRLDIFELKSFVGRVNSGRRKQIDRSLERSAELAPSSWTLVVPIDHTPNELEWFDILKTKYGFPLAWLGRSWLDRQMAEHERIRRYFLEGTDSQVVRLLRELNAEQAGLGNGLPDAIGRLERIRDQLNELDPFYRVNLLIAEGVQVEVLPRYRNAERDRPILITGGFTFPNNEIGLEAAENLKVALKFGEEVQIPSEYITRLSVDGPFGLDEKFVGGGSITLGATGPETVAIDGRLLLSSPSGRMLASLPLRFSERRRGAAGSILHGSDATGSISVRSRLDFETARMVTNLKLAPVEGLLPGALLNVLRFVKNMTAPNRFLLRVGKTNLGEWQNVPAFDSPDQQYINLIEDLDRVQSITRTPFPVPETWSAQDIRELRRAIKFIDGEEGQISARDFNTSLNVTNREALQRWASSSEWMQVALVSDGYTVTIANEDVPLGRAIIHAPAARILNKDEVLERLQYEGEKSIPITFELNPEYSLRVRPAPLEAVTE